MFLNAKSVQGNIPYTYKLTGFYFFWARTAPAITKTAPIYNSEPMWSPKITQLNKIPKIGLLKDKKAWENFKKSKVKIDENFINQKIKDRNNARKKGNY